jgi:hypothetical protein
MRSCATDPGQGDPKVVPRDVKALARAFLWRKMLDAGVHATLEGWRE